MRPAIGQFDREESEYNLPGDEPQVPTYGTEDLEKDWYRHLTPERQKQLSPTGDHHEAWKNDVYDTNIEWMFPEEFKK
jgi:hypothetical protein